MPDATRRHDSAFSVDSGKLSPLDVVLSSAKGALPLPPPPPLFIVGLILPAGAVGFGSAVPVGLTPQDPLITDGLQRTFSFTFPQLNIESALFFALFMAANWQNI